MIPYNNVTIFVSLSWKIYILVHYQHFEDRQVNIYKVNININFSIFISFNKMKNIPLFQFQMMYLNYFLNKIVQRIKNFFSKKTLCKYNNNINWTVKCCGSHMILEIIQTFVDKKFDPLWQFQLINLLFVAEMTEDGRPTPILQRVEFTLQQTQRHC